MAKDDSGDVTVRRMTFGNKASHDLGRTEISVESDSSNFTRWNEISEEKIRDVLQTLYSVRVYCVAGVIWPMQLSSPPQTQSRACLAGPDAHGFMLWMIIITAELRTAICYKYALNSWPIIVIRIVVFLRWQFQMQYLCNIYLYRLAQRESFILCSPCTSSMAHHTLLKSVYAAIARTRDHFILLNRLY